jgi:hypothetical protein
MGFLLKKFIIFVKITMAKIKEIWMEIVDKFGEDVEITEEMFNEFVNQKIENDELKNSEK